MKRWTRLLGALFLLTGVVMVGLTWTVPPNVLAQGPTLMMEVMVGFDGYCRSADSGMWCPVYVVLTNEGPEVTGELLLSESETVGSPEPDVYARSVVLPTHSRKAFHFYLSSAHLRAPLTLSLLSDEGVGKRMLLQERVPILRVDENDRLYGVLSSHPSDLNFFNDVAPAGADAQVAHLSVDALPPDPLGWEGLDVLVIDDVDTTALRDDQYRALETWLAHGGHLIVGGGAGAARTVAGLGDLLPATVAGSLSIDDLSVLSEQWGTSVIPGPYLLADLSPHEGSEVVLSQASSDAGDVALWVRHSYGEGWVDVWALDLSLNPFTRWDDYTHLWEAVMAVRTGALRGLLPQNSYSLWEAVSAIPGVELPSVLQILGFMLCYTVLIGPINYVILRKMDRRELAWVTIPILILGFTGCAYVTGFQVRGGRAILHRLGVVYVPAGGQVGRCMEVVGLFSPRRTEYDLQLDRMGVTSFSDGGFRSAPARQSLRAWVEPEGVRLADLRVDVGGIQPFIVGGYVPVAGAEADLGLVMNASGLIQLKGTVRNGDLPLREAVLISGKEVERLGDLAAGQTVSINLPYRRAVGGNNLQEQIMGTVSYWDDPDLYRRAQFIDALSPYDNPLRLEGGVYLIGWSDTSPVEAQVVDRPFEAFETVLYLYALPVRGLETMHSITVPSSLVSCQPEETEGEVNLWPIGGHLGSEGRVTYRCTLLPGVTLRRVSVIELDVQGTTYSASGDPTISIWNQTEADWDPLVGGWGHHRLTAAEDYFIPPGEVLIRLESGVDASMEIKEISVTITGWQ